LKTLQRLIHSTPLTRKRPNQTWLYSVGGYYKLCHLPMRHKTMIIWDMSCDTQVKEKRGGTRNPAVVRVGRQCSNLEHVCH